MNTEERDDLIREYILFNPSISNSKLAKIIKNGNTNLNNYTEGSLRNYIGKIKKEQIERYIALLGRRAGDINYLMLTCVKIVRDNTELSISQAKSAVDNLSMDNPLVLTIPYHRAKDIFEQLHKAGMHVAWAEPATEEEILALEANNCDISDAYFDDVKKLDGISDTNYANKYPGE